MTERVSRVRQGVPFMGHPMGSWNKKGRPVKGPSPYCSTMYSVPLYGLINLYI